MQAEDIKATPRIFISHSSQDNEFGVNLAERLKRELGEPDSVWYDADDGLHGSDEWLKRIQFEITNRNVFVLLLSPEAVASAWVDQEFQLALRQAVSISGKVLVPVMVRQTDVWPFLKSFQIVSFVSQPFEKAFAELMYAVHHGSSRRSQLQGNVRERLGPPFDQDLLPIPEHFTGRRDELDILLHRLVPASSSAGGQAVVQGVNGLAGVGKSSLAAMATRVLFASNRFPDGIAVVRCSDVSDPSTLLRRVLARFDPTYSEPEETNLSKLTDLVRLVLGGKQALVVLDNVEQGWPIDLAVKPLRAAARAVLITSRVPLPIAAIPIRMQMKLGPLSHDEAIELFAKASGRDDIRALDEAEQFAISRITTLLGNHTLAVTLAGALAARSGRKVESIADEYTADQRLGADLRDGSEGVDIVLESSLYAASQATRNLFNALGAFATNDVGRQAMLAVSSWLGDSHPARSVQELVDLRLLDPYEDETMSARSDRERMRLHPLVRAFSIRSLVALDKVKRHAARDAMVSWFVQYLADLPRALYFELAADDHNIRGALDTALESGDDESVARLGSGVAYFWRNTGRVQAALEYVPRAEQAADRVASGTHDPEDRRMQLALACTLGDVLMAVGRLNESEERYLGTLKLLDKVPDLQVEGTILSALGDLALRRGQPEQAEAYYERALEIAREVNDVRGEALDLLKFGQIAQLRGRLDEAEQFCQQSLPLLQEVEEKKGEGSIYAVLADLALRRGRLDEAEQFCQQSLSFARVVGDKRGEEGNLLTLASIAQLRGNLDEAKSFVQHALDIAQEVQDLHGQAAALAISGDIAIGGDNLDEAEHNFTRSLDVYRQIQNRPGEAAVLHRLGDIELRRGKLAMAEQYFSQALVIDRTSQNWQGLGLDLHSLGDLAALQKRTQEAEQYFQQALQIARETQNRQSEGSILHSLGNLAQDRRDPGKAAHWYEQALAIACEVQDRAGQDVARRGLATAYRSLTTESQQRGDTKQAESYGLRALEISRELHDRKGEGATLAMLGDLMLARRQTDEAQGYFSQALAIAQESQDSAVETTLLHNLGSASAIAGDTIRAEKRYRQALQIAQKTQNREAEGKILHSLGQLFYSRLDLDNAEKYFEDSLRILRDFSEWRGECGLLRELGLVAEAREQWSLAHDYYRKSADLARTTRDALTYAMVIVDLGELLIRHLARGEEGCALLHEGRELRQKIAPWLLGEVEKLISHLGCSDQAIGSNESEQR